MAQAAAPAAPPEAGSAQVIVTAGKRSAAIEKVPVAVTAFTAKQRDLMEIHTVQNISDFTPGLSYYSIADRAYIRGVGRNTDNLGTESAVAFYVNGIYYGANASVAEYHDSLFVSQVEVDRGPQNVLHGSNADAGTINFISALPTSSLYAEGRVGVQDYGEYYGEAVLSGPLDDHVRFRIGGNYTSETGGYFNNLDGPREGGNLPQGNNGHTSYLEGQLQGNWNNFDAWAMVSSGDYVTSFHTVATVGNFNDYEFPNGSLAPVGNFAFCATQPGNLGCNPLFSPDVLIPGSIVTDRVIASQFPGNDPTNVNLHNFIETSNQRNTQNNDIALAVHLTYHFPGADLQYLGGYQSFFYHLDFGPGVDSGVLQYQVQGAPNALAAAPCTGVGIPLAVCEAPLTINPAGNHTDFIEDEQYFSHELNLVSTSQGPLQWIAGVYWYHEHFNQPVGLGCQPSQVQLFHPVGAPGNPDGCVITLDGNLTYDSYAGYGQASYQIDPAWKIEGALRYTDDHKQGYEQFRAVGFDFGAIGLPSAGNWGAATPAIDLSSAFGAAGLFFTFPGASLAHVNPTTGMVVRNLDGSWNGVTGEATLTWTPETGVLAYAKYSRGYKTGGFNAGAIAPDPETAPEYIDNFEAGAKIQIASTFVVNGAVFYENYFNDQQPLETPIGGGVNVLEIKNLPESRLYGLELEGVWRPTDALTFTAEYSYLSAKVTKTGGQCFLNTGDPNAILLHANTTGCAPGTGLQTLLGRTLPEAPPNKFALNAIYVFTFDPGRLSLSASYVWKDQTYGTIWNTAQDLAPAYSTVNLRAQWDDSQNRYTVSAFVDNVFNTNGWDNFGETQYAPAGPYDVLTSKGLTNPLTFGAELQVRFH